MEIRIGIAGWRHSSFKGIVYPAGCPDEEMLQAYCRYFDTVLLDASFLRIHPAKTWLRWGRSVPEGFEFVVKAPRRITHVEALRPSPYYLQRFFSHVMLLGDALGPVLWQLPPSLAYDPELVDGFFGSLPQGIGCLLEGRHPSWRQGRAVSHLRGLGIGMVISDWQGMGPAVELLSGRGPVCIRLAGSGQPYRGRYGKEGLSAWHDYALGLAEAGVGRLYVVFGNTGDGSAALDALEMQRLLLARCR